MTTTLTNSAQIDHLIAASNILTRLASFGGFDYLLDADDEIRAVLNDVPAGMREDVDALLGRKVSDYNRANFDTTVIDVRMRETGDNPWQLSSTIRAAKEARATMSRAMLDLAHAANQGDIDDMLEAAHDAAEDHRHLTSGQAA